MALNVVLSISECHLLFFKKTYATYGRFPTLYCVSPNARQVGDEKLLHFYFAF